MMTLAAFVRNLAKYGKYELELTHSYTPKRQRYFSGFIVNPDNGVMVYVTTETCLNAHCENKMLVRYVKSNHDYSGGTNKFCLPLNSGYFINQLLNSPKAYSVEIERK